ncbi:hypothetical protein ACFCWG_26655 [Streptomyces sp. NPDC056390]|uniref:hypothetical protein n=1 Tax=Streptomyces sp. NPDC056390 TaxID=3345806 RepID=UPI0035DEA3B0
MGLPFNFLLAAPFIVGLLVLLRPRRQGETHLNGAIGRYYRHASRCRTSSLAVGLAAAGCLMYGWSAWLAGTVFGVCVLAGVLIGELRVPRPHGAVRAAMLMPRHVRDYLPRRYAPLLGGLVLALAVLLTVAITVTRRVAGPDGFIHAACPGGVEFLVSQREVWSAVLGVLVCVVGGAALCLFVVRKIVTRPAFPGSSAPDAVDKALRTASAEAVTLVWGCLVASSLLASSAIASIHLEALSSAPCNNHELMASSILTYLLVGGSAAGLIYLLIRLTRLPGPSGAPA